MKPWFDLARLLFALVVVVDHAVILFWLPTHADTAINWFPWLNSAAAVSVSGFFLISGFAIAHSVTPKRRAFSLRLFIANRLARIYPPLICAVLLALILVWAIVPSHLETLGDPSGTTGFGVNHYIASALEGGQIRQAFDVLFMRAAPITADQTTWALLAPAWTLPYEIIMYTIAGASFRLFQTERTVPTAAAVLLWTMLLGWIIWVDSPHLYLLSGLWILGFTLGLGQRTRPVMVLAIVGILAAFLAPYLVSSFLATVVGDGPISAGIIASKLGSPYDESWRLTAGVALLVFGVFFAIGSLNRTLTTNQGTVARPIVGLVPEFSYSLYICHFPILLAWGVLQTQTINDSFTGSLVFVVATPVFIALVACWAISVAAEQKALFARGIARMFGIKMPVYHWA